MYIDPGENPNGQLLLFPIHGEALDIDATKLPLKYPLGRYRASVTLYALLLIPLRNGTFRRVGLLSVPWAMNKKDLLSTKHFLRLYSGFRARLILLV